MPTHAGAMARIARAARSARFVERSIRRTYVSHWSAGKVQLKVRRVDQSGIDLLLELDRSNGRSLRAQLEAELRDAVRAGRLHAGTALPSTRALARELGV